MSALSPLTRRLQRLRRLSAHAFDRQLMTRVRQRRNAQRSYRPIFIAGASGAGTSLLATSLAQRFECAGLIHELDIQMLSRSFLSLPRLSSIPDLAAYEAIITPRPDWSVERGRQDLQDTFRAYCSDPGETVVVKGPDIALARAGFLARCWPDAHFVFTFRDPVANIEGYRRKWPVFGRAPLDQVTGFYRNLHEAFLTSAASLAERVVGVEYETLVRDPDAALDEIGTRLGLRPARSARRLAAREAGAGKGLRNVRDGRIELTQDASQRAIERVSGPEADAIRKDLGALHERMRALPFLVRPGDSAAP